MQNSATLHGKKTVIFLSLHGVMIRRATLYGKRLLITDQKAKSSNLFGRAAFPIVA